MFQLAEEPAVNLCEFVDAVYVVLLEVHGLGDYEHSLVGWFAKGCIYVCYLQFLVLYEAVHTLSNHAQSLLNGFLEGASDGHHFAH